MVSKRSDTARVKESGDGNQVILKNLIAGNQEIPLYIVGLDEIKTKLERRIQNMLKMGLANYIQSKKTAGTNGEPPNMPTSVSVSFESLRVPFEIQQDLQLQAHEIITEVDPKHAALTAASSCVYTPIYPPASIARNFPAPAPSEQWFRWSPSSEDGFDVYVSRPNVYPSNQMWVGLQLGPYMWAKEIQAWHYHPNKQTKGK